MEVTTTDGQGSPAADKTPDAVRRAASHRLPKQLRQILSLNDLDLAGRRFLPRPLFAYVSGAAESAWSLCMAHENRGSVKGGLRPLLQGHADE